MDPRGRRRGSILRLRVGEDRSAENLVSTPTKKKEVVVCECRKKVGRSREHILDTYWRNWKVEGYRYWLFAAKFRRVEKLETSKALEFDDIMKERETGTTRVPLRRSSRLYQSLSSQCVSAQMPLADVQVFLQRDVSLGVEYQHGKNVMRKQEFIYVPYRHAQTASRSFLEYGAFSISFPYVIPLEGPP